MVDETTLVVFLYARLVIYMYKRSTSAKPNANKSYCRLLSKCSNKGPVYRGLLGGSQGALQAEETAGMEKATPVGFEPTPSERNRFRHSFESVALTTQPKCLMGLICIICLRNGHNSGEFG